MSKVSAIIPAAGAGKRMEEKVSKQYLMLDDRPIIVKTVEIFQNSPQIDEIILVSPAAEIDYSREIVEKASLTKVTKIVEGGAERQDSIQNGLNALNPDDPSTDIVVIHDGVRPLASRELIEETINNAKSKGAAMLAVPVKDTVKEVHKGTISKTVPRKNLWLAQTPQTFRYDIIKTAFEFARDNNIIATDDASLVEAMGGEVSIVLGSYENIKITTPEDLVIAEAILKERKR